MYKPSFSVGEMRVRTPSFRLPCSHSFIAYTYIRKNACSTFKTYLTRCAGVSDIADPEVRKLRVNMDRVKPERVKHSIFVYRDPFERIVSGFLNKFVVNRASLVLDNYRKITGADPFDASFMDFLSYLETGAGEVDSHFWPQKAHLAEFTYTHPIHISRVTEVLSAMLNGEPHAETFAHKANETRYDPADNIDLRLTPLRDLITMHDGGRAFAKQGFRNEEVLDRLQNLYASDYQMIAEIEDGAGGRRNPGNR
jgi:hypothetical protein